VRAFTRALALACALVCGAAAPALAQPASLAGTYDGRQMEMAAALELKPDGRFRYALSYGALDEEAAGRWTASGDRVLLTGDPVRAPRFVSVSQGRGADGVLRLDLDVPKGVSRQYFDAEITKADGSVERRQLSDEGLIFPFAPTGRPTGVRLVLPMYRVASEPVRLDPSSGYAVRFRFEPNDIGKADFRGTVLRIVGTDLVLDRHGRTIRFKRTAP
jgi:hypothetical protein